MSEEVESEGGSSLREARRRVKRDRIQLLNYTDMPTVSEKDYELLERFFSFSMDEKERIAMEVKLDSDPLWKEKMRRYQEVENQLGMQFGKEGEAISEEVRNGWKTPVSSGRSGKSEKSPLQIKWRQILSIAAAFLMIAVVSFWIFQMNTTSNAQQLAMEMWQQTPIQNSLSVRSENDLTTTQKQLQKALVDYANKDYQAVLTQLDDILPSSDIYAQSLLLRGQSYFGLHQMQNAIASYHSLIDLPNGNAKDLAYWLQALAYLQVDNQAAARVNLQFLIDGKYGFAPKAEELLKQMN